MKKNAAPSAVQGQGGSRGPSHGPEAVSSDFQQLGLSWLLSEGGAAVLIPTLKANGEGHLAAPAGSFVSTFPGAIHSPPAEFLPLTLSLAPFPTSALLSKLGSLP